MGEEYSIFRFSAGAAILLNVDCFSILTRVSEVDFILCFAFFHFSNFFHVEFRAEKISWI